MAITVSGNSIVFPDSTTQTTAFSGGGGGGIQGLEVYNNPGTFTTPANTTSVYLIGVSGGGGGGGGKEFAQPESPAFSPGAPGGSGLMGVGVYPVTASTTYAIQSGGGGTAGFSSPQNNPAPQTDGGTGGSTSFGNLMTVNGGNGGSKSGVPGLPPGNPGTSTSAQLTANIGPTSVVQALLVTNPGNPGTGGPGSAGSSGQPGKLFIYF
jgi:hypothetical protein